MPLSLADAEKALDELIQELDPVLPKPSVTTSVPTLYSFDARFKRGGSGSRIERRRLTVKCGAPGLERWAALESSKKKLLIHDLRNLVHARVQVMPLGHKESSEAEPLVVDLQNVLEDSAQR
jgi:hypothetical protein